MVGFVHGLPIGIKHFDLMNGRKWLFPDARLSLPIRKKNIGDG
jgi:hypothetical protein